jgi:hypothetical protein
MARTISTDAFAPATQPLKLAPHTIITASSSPASNTLLRMISTGDDRSERKSLDLSKTTYSSLIKSPKDACIAVSAVHPFCCITRHPSLRPGPILFFSFDSHCCPHLNATPMFFAHVLDAPPPTTTKNNNQFAEKGMSNAKDALAQDLAPVDPGWMLRWLWRAPRTERCRQHGRRGRHEPRSVEAHVRSSCSLRSSL